MTNNFSVKKNRNRQQLSPEEYKQLKNDEKKNVYRLIDTAISDLVNNPDEFQKFLDTQARMDRYSAANALLIYKQCPEATQLKDFNGWRDDNIRINALIRVLKAFQFLSQSIIQSQMEVLEFLMLLRSHLMFLRQVEKDSLLQQLIVIQRDWFLL